MLYWFSCLALCIVLSSILVRIISYFRRTQFPPGPKTLPFVGNALDMPQDRLWETADKWSKVYGDLIHLKVFSKHFVLINSYDLAVQLLEKRSAIYSSRPRMVMSCELQGWGCLPLLMPSGEEQQKARQMFLRSLHPTSIRDYNPVMRRGVHELLSRLCKSPEQFFDHIRHCAGSTITSVTYGYEVGPQNDPCVNLAEEAVAHLSRSLGFNAVDYLPALRYLPRWFPGAGFQRTAEEGRRIAMDSLNLPYAMAKEWMLKGKTHPSIFDKLLGERLETRENEFEERVKATLTTMYIGGNDTVVSASLSFILAMTLYPEAQHHAQDEIDAIVGKGNLPTFEDLSNLPYLNAIYYEVLRWHPAGPLGIPHSTTIDDTYREFLIPAGSTIIANIWAMARDPKHYPEPECFKPERFLRKEGSVPPLNPESIVFGFGRRSCPGKHYAEKLIKMMIASCLAVFNIDKAIGEDGRLITPSEEYLSNIASHPLPFKCRITPRIPDLETTLARLLDAEA